MITFLRVASFLTNCAYVVGIALLSGAGWGVAAIACSVFFFVSWWACGRHPATSEASPEIVRLAADVAARMGASAPREVRTVPGRTAAAVRFGRGYTLLLGDEVSNEHADALLAHEVAHVVTGDILWESWTDGPARIFASAARSNALLWILAFPFLIFGVPLARVTELRADQLAAEAVPSYPAVLKEFMASESAQSSVLYPSLGERLRHTARDSLSRAKQ